MSKKILIISSLLNSRGSMLLLTMLLLTAALTVAMGISTLAIIQIKMGGTQAQSTRAYFAAETGAEIMLWQIRKNGLNFSSCTPGQYIDYDDCGGTPPCCISSAKIYEFPTTGQKFYIQYLIDGTDTVIKCYGEYFDTRRAVELRY
jgi:hypothetical protein